MKKLRAVIGLGALLVTSVVMPAAGATEADRANQCINPVGADLNEVYDTDDAFATRFCGDGQAGSWWRPLLRWVGAPTHDVVPEGYEPIGATPALDFVTKLNSARYVVDAGTRRERTFTFDADELLIATGELPDGTEFVAFTPRLPPMSVGEHTIDLFAEMRAVSWDGLGTEPWNSIPAGEEHITSVSIVVHSAHDQG